MTPNYGVNYGREQVQQTANLSGVGQIDDMSHVFLLSNGFTTRANDDVLGVNANELGDWCCGESVCLRQRVFQKNWIVRKGVSFRAQVVDEESMKYLDFVCVIHF